MAEDPQSQGVPAVVKDPAPEVAVLIEEEEAPKVDAEVGKTLDDNSVVKPCAPKEKRDFPMRETVISLGSGGELRFNWFVSLFGLAFLWGISIYCMVEPDKAKVTLDEWFAETIQYFTWFYIVGNPIMTFFIFWLAYRYGNIKLGHKDAEPEFSDMSYFAMLFSAGVGVGLFFYGVSEPLWHQNSNYFSEAGYRSQDEIDQWALEITLYHWGFAGWSPYIMIAICCGLASYAFDLPLTVRSCFYPIFGEYIWGWIGDAIDGWSVVMTVAGVCTSLGLGVIQITTGLQRLEWVDPTKTELTGVYVAIIWIVTAFATISVVTGLKMGIKFLSVLGFSLGCLILFLCFVMEKSYYLMNLLVQTTGFYMQWSIFQVPFWTDSFGSLNPGEGRSVDGNSSETWWIGAWTVFYMAWWVAWACFVGLFIARISKNRTIRSVVFGVFLAPTAYAIIWFSFMGGIGLRQARQALELEKLGTDFFQDAAHYQSDSSEFCYDVPQEDVYVDGVEDPIFVNTLPGITPVCKFDTTSSPAAWFNVMYSYSYPGTGPDGNFGGFGQFLSGLSIFTLAIYFITSSDSGSLVVDTLASNGAEEHHWLQRVFWAFTEGGVATGLLVAGGSDALGALQAASIVFGLPFNFLIIIMCWCILVMCRTLEEHGQANENMDARLFMPKKTWKMPVYGGICNVMEVLFSFGNINKTLQASGLTAPTAQHFVGFAKNALFPFVTLYSVYSAIDLKGKNKVTNIIGTLSYAALHVGWIVLFICGTINYGFVALAWTMFFTNTCILISVRMTLRGMIGISGNIVGDFVACSFLYPQALLQMEIQLAAEGDLSAGDS
mmetsp:Transcript_20322/g.39118  ORF Transcript_20322/g.39118 Transcript_20322/m.39118 type:complete len:830 (-) Transcript_20322:178-2667(-)